MGCVDVAYAAQVHTLAQDLTWGFEFRFTLAAFLIGDFGPLDAGSGTVEMLRLCNLHL